MVQELLFSFPIHSITCGRKCRTVNPHPSANNYSQHGKEEEEEEPLVNMIYIFN